MSAKAASILAGRALSLGDGARDEGEDGTEVEALREWRIYLDESLSISC